MRKDGGSEAGQAAAKALGRNDKRWFSGFENSSEFYELVNSDTSKAGWHELGHVSGQSSEKVAKIVGGGHSTYRVVIDADRARLIEKEHGSSSSNQHKMTAEDLDLIEDVMNHADQIVPGQEKTKDGAATVEFRKRYGCRHVVIAAAYEPGARRKEAELRVITAYKQA